MNIHVVWARRKAVKADVRYPVDGKRRALVPNEPCPLLPHGLRATLIVVFG